MHLHRIYNSAVGMYALAYNTSATNTVAIGYNAGSGGVTPYSNQGGVYAGYQAGYSASTGSNYNTLLGYQAGYGITTGGYNIVIGQNIEAPSVTGSQQLNIGNLIYGTGVYNGASVSSVPVAGNIGIGTTSPWRALSVNGSSDLGTNALAGSFTATSTTVASTFAKDIQISNTSDPSLLITKTGQSSFNISATGSNGGAKFTSTSGNAGYRPISFETNSGSASLSRLFISGLGLIGINDITPSHILDISLPADSDVKTSAFSGIKVSNTATSTTSSISKSGIEIVSTGSWSGTSANKIGLYISSVTGGTNNYDAIFNGGGNVGVGTTSPWRKFSVTGTAGFDGLTGSTGAGSVCLSSNNELVYNSGSDACLPSLRETKHDIETLSLDALSVVNGLMPTSFVYNDGDQRLRYGFIADEVEGIDARLVTYNADGDLSGIDDRAIISILVKAVKELVAKINKVLAWFVDGTFNVQNDICVDDVCVTKDQFKALLLDAGGTVHQESVSDDETEESDEQDTIHDDIVSTSTPTTIPESSTTVSTSTDDVGETDTEHETEAGTADDSVASSTQEVSEQTTPVEDNNIEEIDVVEEEPVEEPATEEGIEETPTETTTEVVEETSSE